MIQLRMLGSRASLAPRIHHRLLCDIRHRYRRYRARYLHRTRGHCGPSYGNVARLATLSLTHLICPITAVTCNIGDHSDMAQRL